jgi:hypothetical protein
MSGPFWNLIQGIFIVRWVGVWWKILRAYKGRWRCEIDGEREETVAGAGVLPEPMSVFGEPARQMGVPRHLLGSQGVLCPRDSEWSTARVSDSHPGDQLS